MWQKLMILIIYNIPNQLSLTLQKQWSILLYFCTEVDQEFYSHTVETQFNFYCCHHVTFPSGDFPHTEREQNGNLFVSRNLRLFNKYHFPALSLWLGNDDSCRFFWLFHALLK